MGTGQKTLVFGKALLLVIANLSLFTTLTACTKTEGGETALRGKTSNVGTVKVIRYQPDDVRSLGFDPAGIDKLVERFAGLIEEGRHAGAQLGIYREGRLVLALAAGTDVATGQQITFDSLFCMRSCTKSLTALVMAGLYEQGLFKFDDPVAKYWPEFAQNGKESITIGQVMSHRAGIPQSIPIPVSLYGDRGAVARAVEGLEPIWVPGSVNGYHASTYGFVLEELALRLTGHSIAELLQTEYVQPLGIKDIYLGLPQSEYKRFCPMAVLDNATPDRTAFSDFINSYQGIKLPLSWVAGVANAWDLAELFNIFAYEGTFAGQTFFSKETQALMSTPTNSPGELDVIVRWQVRWGLGLILGDTPDIYGTPPHARAIGHAGGGASVVWADPDEHLAVAFLCNGMRTGGREWERYRILGDLVYASLL